jgi:hypothetical protein
MRQNYYTNERMREEMMKSLRLRHTVLPRPIYCTHRALDSMLILEKIEVPYRIVIDPIDVFTPSLLVIVFCCLFCVALNMRTQKRRKVEISSYISNT